MIHFKCNPIQGTSLTPNAVYQLSDSLQVKSVNKPQVTVGNQQSYPWETDYRKKGSEKAKVGN